ncbi:MAG: hypothetical protein WBE86_01950 [Candidatus Acidiferrales bacterium]
MTQNSDKKSVIVSTLHGGHQPAPSNRGHQPSKAFDKGYQASGQVKPPTTTPNVGTTAVIPVAAANGQPTTAAAQPGNVKK